MPLPSWFLFWTGYWILLAAGYRLKKHYWTGLTLVTVFFAYLCTGLPLAAIPAFVLLVTSVACRRKQARPRTYYVAAGSVMLLTFVAILPRSREVADLLERYPPESLETRLQTRSSGVAVTIDRNELSKLDRQAGFESQEMVPPNIAEHLKEIESYRHAIDSMMGIRGRSYALRQLAGLHRSALKIFVDSPGFGVSRVRHIPVRSSQVVLPPLPLIPQLATLRSHAASKQPEPSTETTPAFSLPAFERGHTLNVSNFVNPAGFGFPLYPDKLWFAPERYDLKQSTTVGFQAHGFRTAPQTLAPQDDFNWPLYYRTRAAIRGYTVREEHKLKPEPWRIERLDLVSLWLNDPPAVYVSENLPQMGELRTAPLRSLTAFEADGLRALARGEMLSLSQTDDLIEVMGAIRASNSCLNCHDVVPGQLLGAFSYTLSPLKQPVSE